MSLGAMEVSRGVRWRLAGVVRRSPEKGYARRALALLQRWETRGRVSDAAQRLRVTRSSVHRWRSLHEGAFGPGRNPVTGGR